jgi:hypothetical protein
MTAAMRCVEMKMMCKTYIARFTISAALIIAKELPI